MGTKIFDLVTLKSDLLLRNFNLDYIFLLEEVGLSY